MPACAPRSPCTPRGGAGLGVELEKVAEGLYAAALSGLRMELVQTATGFTVINDAYNANPTSMAAALRALARVDAVRRVAVLGTMAELGADSAAAHREVAELALSLGIAVVAVDEPRYGDDVEHVDDAQAAADHVTVLPTAPVAVLIARASTSPFQPDDHVTGLGGPLALLVKGSRVAALERVVELLDAGRR